jgi:hypothetical protein
MKVLLYEYLKRPTRFTRFLFNYKSIFAASDINVVTTGKVDFVIVDCESLNTKSTDSAIIWDELQDSRGGGKLYVLIDDGRFLDVPFNSSDWFGTPIIGIGKHQGINCDMGALFPSIDERREFFTRFTPFVYDYRMTDITIGDKPVDISIASDVNVPDDLNVVYQRVDCPTDKVTDDALVALKNSKYFVCSHPNLDLIYHAIRFGTIVLVNGIEPKVSIITSDILSTDCSYFEDWRALMDIDVAVVKDDQRVNWNDEQARSKFLGYWVNFLI